VRLQCIQIPNADGSLPGTEETTRGEDVKGAVMIVALKRMCREGSLVYLAAIIGPRIRFHAPGIGDKHEFLGFVGGRCPCDFGESNVRVAGLERKISSAGSGLVEEKIGK
jgi:hypothetical protein